MMLKNIISFLSGLIFGIGLLIAQMTNPAKVIGFLDITGKWDISLALVIGGALIVAFGGFFIAKKRIANHKMSFSSDPINLPTNTKITKQLIIGSMMFGVGWGLVGLCPAPVIILVGTMSWQAVVFTLAMLLGMWIYQLTAKYL